MRVLSLKVRLFLTVGLFVLGLLAVTGVLGLQSVNREISENYDARLITEAYVLWQLTEDGAEDLGDETEFTELDTGRDTPLLKKIQRDLMARASEWRAYRIWKNDTMVLRSDNADILPEKPMGAGFSTVRVGEERWRVFAIHVPSMGMIVETFENLQNRKILQRDIVYGVVGPLLLLLPVLALLLALGIHAGLARLRGLARQLEARSPGDLSRLESDSLPRELRPLAEGVNVLLSKLEATLAHEREFTDHAAHELRTPLTALKLEAQLLARQLEETPHRQATEELLQGVERATRLVEQLLMLSRVAHQEIQLVEVPVAHLVRDTIGMYALRAADKHITLSFEEAEENLDVPGQPELLRTLIGTLLDNAIKYTPEGGEVALALWRDAFGETILSLCDSGPGIAPEERGRVFERFYRIAGSRQPGSGLGLAIARQIASLLNMRIALESAPEGGLCVRVTVPVLSQD